MKNTANVLAIALIVCLAGTGVGQATQFASATTIVEEQVNEDNLPVNTVESVTDTHNAIMQSLDATEDVPDEFNSRWTNPGTVQGDGGITLFVVDCLPGEYPATPQFMLAEGVGILQQYVIGSGADYLSMMYLVANFGEDDQVVKMGVTCIDEDGAESGDGDNDGDDGDVTRVTNNFVTNIINNIVNNINTNVTIITNNTNVTIVPPPNNTGGNTTDPGGNTTDPGTGGNTTDPGGNTTIPEEPEAPIENLTSTGIEPAVEEESPPPAAVTEENTTDTTPDAAIEEEEETTETTTPPVTEEETTPPAVEEETTPPAIEEENTETAEELEESTEEETTPTTETTTTEGDEPN